MKEEEIMKIGRENVFNRGYVGWERNEWYVRRRFKRCIDLLKEGICRSKEIFGIVKRVYRMELVRNFEIEVKVVGERRWESRGRRFKWIFIYLKRNWR